MEEKLDLEVNGTALYILQAVGFTYEYTDLDLLCRELDVATFADFKRVSATTIAGATLRSPILRRKLTDLCAHCIDVDTYKRWRRRHIRFNEMSHAQVAATQRARAEEEGRNTRAREWAASAQHQGLTALLGRLQVGAR